jgi:hypothetical protein
MVRLVKVLRPGLTFTAGSFPNDTLGLGGVNLECKEFVFEPNSQDDFGVKVQRRLRPRPQRSADQSQVVRNRSGIYLKGGLLAHYDEGGARSRSARTRSGRSIWRPEWTATPTSFPTARPA